MTVATQAFVFPPDGAIPNHTLPLVLYPEGLTPALRNPSDCQSLFARNSWGGNWVDGILEYWHFHVTGHEVLGCVAGEAEVGFGGDAGIVRTVRAGNVVVIPAGVGHKRLSAKRGGFTIVGGYPPNQSGEIIRAGDMPPDEAHARIAKLALPRTDPVNGNDGPLLHAWRIR